jgi:hypothetical protein
MGISENGKRLTEKATSWARPRPAAFKDLLRKRQPIRFRFRDDGSVPNHPRWPLVYQSSVKLTDDLDPAAIFEGLFEKNGWSDSGEPVAYRMPTRKPA